MKQRSFFFDTANTKDISRIWNKLKYTFDAEDVVGITTNPNAMFKEELKTMSEWKTRVEDMASLLEDIKGNNNGLVYIQGPSSNMSIYDIQVFIKDFIPHCKCSKLGIKIPPFDKILSYTDKLRDFYPNVTGIADCSTALKTISYGGMNYISIIPGRMEEKGIDAKSQIAYVRQGVNEQDRYTAVPQIITGSMRTLEGLQWVIEYGTVPTIGTKVFDIIFNEEKVDDFANYWNTSINPVLKYTPEVTKDQIDLSKAFFEQMDKVGEAPYTDFLTH